MSWQLLIAISVIISAIPVLLQRILLKDDEIEPISFSIVFQLGVAFVISILTLIIKGSITFPNMQTLSSSILLMTITYSLANIYIFKSLKITEASRFTVIFASKTLFAIIASTIFFQEGLTNFQWIGALLLIIGVVVVYFQNNHSRLNKGDFYALLAAILFGIANTNDRYLVQSFEPYSYVVLGFLLPGITIAMLNPSKIKNIKTYFHRAFISKMALLCLLYGIAAVTFFAALQLSTNSSQIFTINAFGAILTVILSIIFLKERDALARKLIGATVSLIGLLLVNK